MHHVKSSKLLLRQSSSPEENDVDVDPVWEERSKHRVVLVDDEESVRNAVGRFLFDEGYRVAAYADASSAFADMINTMEPPHCVITDVRMPGMDGIELLKSVRNNKRLIRIPVVLLASKDTTNERIQGYEAGADSYLTKPFAPEELLAIVDSLIERTKLFSEDCITIDDLKRDLDEIKRLVEAGGVGVGNGWVKAGVFLAKDERVLLELICEGDTNKEIAERLFLSTRRIEAMVSALFRKTNTATRTALVRWAISTGNVGLHK